ncbi:transglycosylase SLT domain-containing protein [Endozoicomonadaceae bacterium StTr2]
MIHRGGRLKSCSIILFCLILVGCAGTTTRPPSKPHNLCHMFKNQSGWHRAAVKSNKRWGTPVHVMMAIMHQESSFKHNARPPRKRYLGFIPGPRPSTAYGYAQALDGVWQEYLKEAGRWFAKRDDFADAIDFIGWYTRKSRKVNGVSLWRADHLYLNYHEGMGGYRRGTHKKKKWLLNVANKVHWRAKEYGQQLRTCRGL